MPPTARNMLRAQPPGKGPSDDTIEHLYLTEGPRLLRYFRSRTRDSHAASDLMQEAFVRLADSMSKSPPLQPGPYLQRIARNLLFDRSKRLERRLAKSVIPYEEAVDPGVPPDQAYGIEAADVMRVYRRALAELPEKTRQIFLLHRVEEMTYKDIGLQLGISIPTVQYHVARALAHIDAALERE